MVVLYEHNKKALELVEDSFKTTNRGAVTQPTGTGKSYIAYAFIKRHPTMRVAYLAPSTIIFDQIQRIAEKDGVVLNNTTFISYQKLQRADPDDVRAMHFDCIIFDEYHRCGAPLWQVAIKQLERANPNALFLGLSATPIRYLDDMRDMTEELFHGNIITQYSMADAIEDSILPKPLYVLANINMEDAYRQALERFNGLKSEVDSVKFVNELSKCLDDMRRNIDKASGVDEIFDRFMPINAKLIVFCSSYDHIKTARAAMKKWLGAPSEKKELHEYICKAYDDELKASDELMKFIRDKAKAIRLLYVVDMLNEGLHVDDVDGIVMLRPTISPNVYIQQMGRALAAGKSKSQPIIFDLVNNYQSVRTGDAGRRVADDELGGCFDDDSNISDVDIPKRFKLTDFEVVDEVVKFMQIQSRFDNIAATSRTELIMQKVRRWKELSRLVAI